MPSQDLVEVNRITGIIVDSAIRIHKELGPGLLESVYELVLTASLERRGLAVRRQQPVDFEFDGIFFEQSLRVDLLVNGMVVVELKSVEVIAPVHPKQVLTYIRLLNLPVGLLINFGAPTLKEGVSRIINDRYQSPQPSVR